MMPHLLVVACILTCCTALQLLHVVTFTRNDVLALLEASAGTQPFALRTYSSIDAALGTARPGDSLLVLGDGTLGAASGVNFTHSHWSTLLSLNLTGFYIELAGTLPNDPTLYTPSKAYYFDRVTARTSDLVPQGVQPLDIIQAQGAFFQNYPVAPYINSSSLAYAHVAGSSTAVYGLPPPASLNPVLFTPFPDAPTGLLGSIALSCLVSCRYTPLPKWRGVWNFLLTQVLGTPYTSFPTWTPLVAPYGANPAPALAAAAASAAVGGADLLFRAVAPNLTTAALRATDFLYSGSGLLIWGDVTTCPVPFAPPSANVACMLEGFGSELSPAGDQPIADDARMDCSAESAMALALRARVEGQGGGRAFATAAAALMNFTWLYSAAAQGHNDPLKPDFGIVAWGVSSGGWATASYGDDNARVIVASMVASAALGGGGGGGGGALPTLPWDAMVGRSLLGNLRLCSTHGFRPGRINYPDLTPGGWQRFRYSGDTYLNTSSPQPHYQAQMWAAFLLAYARTCVTGACFTPFYTAALAGLEGTMEAYLAAAAAAADVGGEGGGTFKTTSSPRWAWTEYGSEEQARLLLPLAWLVRAEAAGGHPVNGTHVGWVSRVAADYLGTQGESGGVHETLGPPGQCDACPPPSNAAYGTGEAPLIARTGEAITDQLYSNNFGLVGLVEAAGGGGGNAAAGAGALRLGAYLAAIQVRAEGGVVGKLDGAWMRGFDTELWDFDGAAADWGWGPWSIETGWSVTWSASSLFSLAGNSTLFDTVMAQSVQAGITADLVKELCPLFFNDTEVTCP